MRHLSQNSLLTDWVSYLYAGDMPRTAPPDRLRELIAVAAASFVRHGVHHTQMDDIAADLGVSKGTVYRYVSSKEALLAAVLDYGDRPDGLPATGSLEASDLNDVSRRLRTGLGRSVASLQLAQTLNSLRSGIAPIDRGEEIEHIARGLFETMAAHRVQIMVMDRCAAELPELARDWYGSGRYAIVDMVAEYLSLVQPEAGIDQAVLARSIVELITVWAVKIPWDPAPRTYTPDLASECAAMVRNLVTGATS